MKIRIDMRLGRLPNQNVVVIEHSFGLTVADGFVFVPYCTCGNWIGGYISSGFPADKADEAKAQWGVHLLTKNVGRGT